MYNVLFLCTHNSARSVMAECILNARGGGKFCGFSAGSQPRGEINPLALAELTRSGHDVSGLRSKSWDEFAKPGAPRMDFIFTVCGDAAGEVCPVWPGQPISAHWGIADPSRAQGTQAEKSLAFSEAYKLLDQRIGAFVNLPIGTLDRISLQRRLDDIGEGAKASATEDE